MDTDSGVLLNGALQQTGRFAFLVRLERNGELEVGEKRISEELFVLGPKA
jgi:hypothetical protein